jgi:putative ABC transport system substrate-binding protein
MHALPNQYTTHLMKRRALLFSLAALATAPPARLFAQAGRIWRIGILETVAPDLNARNFGALRRGLQERGYAEGHNLQIDYRSADGHAERFAQLAQALVASGVDLIVTRGTPAARAAKEATTTIPIVMAAIGEPLNVGVVVSLARPGGNVTGLSAYVTELAGKRIELLKTAFPMLRRVGFMQNMENPVAPPQWEATQKAAETLGLSSELIDIRDEAGIRRAFSALTGQQVGALSVGIDALSQAYAGLIVELAAAGNVITAYPSREFVDAGGLLSYGPSYPDLYYRAAGMIDRIFKGAKPGDMPVEQPTKLEMVINLKTARALGVTLPQSLLAAADEVLE